MYNHKLLGRFRWRAPSKVSSIEWLYLPEMNGWANPLKSFKLFITHLQNPCWSLHRNREPLEVENRICVWNWNREFKARENERACVHWTVSSLSFLLLSMDIPSDMGGFLWKGIRPMSQDGTGFTFPEDTAVPGSLFCGSFLMAPLVLLPSIRSRPIP